MKRQQKLFSLTIITTLSLLSSISMAQVYTCIQNGEVVYTSNPKGKCKAANLPKIGSYSSDSNLSQPKNVSTKPTVKAKPKNNTNKTNNRNTANSSVNIVPKGSDNTRRSILEQELANERRALTQAQGSFNQNRNNKQLESAVRDRQQNIQALQRELGRM